VFLPLGGLLFVVAVAKLGFDWSSRDFRLSTNTLLIFFAALQVTTLGLLADLVVRATRRRLDVDPV
jgi:hypothetical protein